MPAAAGILDCPRCKQHRRGWRAFTRHDERGRAGGSVIRRVGKPAAGTTPPWLKMLIFGIVPTGGSGYLRGRQRASRPVGGGTLPR